ncbi:FecR domain-containing protein [Microbulbifer sp. SSSA002]|uniref:FecR domain-containing protein n=1 Tax=unclassified Microbulbifer TaxID=2619833 RepID=UPI004039780B
MSDSTDQIKEKIPEAVLLQAVSWRVRLGSGEALDSERDACQQWRSANPLHELAWQRFERMESPLNKAASRAPRLAHATLAQTDAEVRRLNRRAALKTMGGGALGLFAVGLVGYDRGLVARISADFSAGAESAHYTLNDSSQVWLNADSAIEWKSGAEYRSLVLSRGEMQLTSAADPRPMRVSVSQSQIVSAGSRFFLRNGGDHTILQILEGAVQVFPKVGGQSFAAKAGQAYRLSGGEALALDGKMFDYSGWIDGVLSARRMPLAELLEELSRYRSGFLRCDPKLANHLVSGVFQLHDTDMILKTLARSAGAELRYVTRWWAAIQLPS